MNDGVGGAASIVQARRLPAPLLLRHHHCSPTHPLLDVTLSTVALRSSPLQAPSVTFHLPTQLDAEADFVIPKPPVPNVPLPFSLKVSLLFSIPVLSLLLFPSFSRTGEPIHPVRRVVAALPHSRP